MKEQKRQRRTYGLAEDRDSEEEEEEDRKEAEERTKALASTLAASDADADEMPTDAQEAIAQQGEGLGFCVPLLPLTLSVSRSGEAEGGDQGGERGAKAWKSG